MLHEVAHRDHGLFAVQERRQGSTSGVLCWVCPVHVDMVRAPAEFGRANVESGNFGPDADDSFSRRGAIASPSPARSLGKGKPCSRLQTRR